MAKHLAFLLLLALSFSIQFFGWTTARTSPEGNQKFNSSDTILYKYPALTLVHEGKLLNAAYTGDVPLFYRVPGYPVFLAGIISIFGDDDSAITFIQILISLACVTLVYFMLASQVSIGCALLASALLALDPCFFSSSLWVLTDTLFCFLITCFVCTLKPVSRVFDGKSPSYIPMLIGGFILAIATFVRPVGYYLVFFYTLLFLGLGIRKKNIKVALKSACALFLPFLVLIGSWQVRNKLLVDCWEYNQQAAVQLLQYRAARIIARRENISWEEASEKLVPSSELNEAMKHPEKHLSNAWKKKALEIYLAHPYDFFALHLNDMIHLFSSPGYYDYLSFVSKEPEMPGPIESLLHRPLSYFLEHWIHRNLFTTSVAMYSWAHLAVLYSGFLIWCYLCLTQKIRLDVSQLMCLLIVFYFTVYTDNTYYRIRIPMLPVISMLSAQGYLLLIKRRLAMSDAGQKYCTRPPAHGSTGVSN